MSYSDPCRQLEELKKSLPHIDTLQIDKEFDELILRFKGIIEKEMNIDLNHIHLVNLCINPFTKDSTIRSGYFFIRTDPLLSIDKIFDLLLYQPESKVAILIECKTSISDPIEEVKEVITKVDISRRNINLIQNIVGDVVNDIECVICVPPENIVSVKDAVRNLPTPICLWSANPLNNIIFLVPLDEDRTKKPWERGVHRDDNLSRLLIDTIKPAGGGVRIQPFLATSHMGIIVSELLVRLSLELKTTATSQFSRSDIISLLEKYLPNHDLTEIERVASSSLQVACEIGVAFDNTPHESDVSKKVFSLTIRRLNGEKIKDRYVKHKARNDACKQQIKNIGRRYGGLSKFIEKSP